MYPTPLPSSAALAFLGDAVHTLYVRERLVKQGTSHAGDLNRMAQEFVTAQRQEMAWSLIEPHLTEEERDVFRRAFNSSHLNRPRHVSGKTYRTATGFEAVLGMLSYLGNTDRLHALLAIAYPD